MSTQPSQVGLLNATTTALTTATVTKIGVLNNNRTMATLSNETGTDFYYAFGTNTSTIADFAATSMFILRANTDLYFTDGVPTGPLFVLQSSGGPLNIKTYLN